MDDNVVNLVNKEGAKENTYVDVTYKNGDTEKFKCDFMGISEAVTGFLYIGKDSDYDEQIFISLDTILKIKTSTNFNEIAMNRNILGAGLDN